MIKQIQTYWLSFDFHVEYIIHNEDENVVFTSHGDQVEVEAAQNGYLRLQAITGEWPDRAPENLEPE